MFGACGQSLGCSGVRTMSEESRGVVAAMHASVWTGVMAWPWTTGVLDDNEECDLGYILTGFEVCMFWSDGSSDTQRARTRIWCILQPERKVSGPSWTVCAYSETVSYCFAFRHVGVVFRWGDGTLGKRPDIPMHSVSSSWPMGHDVHKWFSRFWPFMHDCWWSYGVNAGNCRVLHTICFICFNRVSGIHRDKIEMNVLSTGPNVSPSLTKFSKNSSNFIVFAIYRNIFSFNFNKL